MIKLGKGNSISLSKDGDKLSKVMLNLNWETKQNVGKIDLDATCFGLVESNNLESKRELYEEEYFIYYHNDKSPNGSIIHSGDDLTGATGESITVDLSLIPNSIIEIAFFITIHNAQKRGHDFGMIQSSSISLVNSENDDILAKFQVENDSTFNGKTAIQLGSLYRDNGEWNFKAIGVAYNSDLQKILEKYGIQAEN